MIISIGGTNKWGEGFKQQIFQEEPKVEDPSSVCGYLLQKDSFLETLQEREIEINFSHQLYDLVDDYMASFFGQQTFQENEAATIFSRQVHACFDF